ncbi:MAG: hypothetical protein EA356_09370 [Geminicoccaceae bacterium]|nr:MAG: hypothetical protein EA356_09370 [Geminicoccaceae bacterium]
MTQPATKLTIVVERLLEPVVERLLEAAQIKGYSVFPGGGRGSHGTHHAYSAQVVREFAIVKYEIVVADRAKAERVADTLISQHLTHQPGIVWLETVDVLRAWKFASS